MPAHRYRPPNGIRPEEEKLPLDTDLTILTRQSTLKQRERNTFSAELNPDELIREGQRLGFHPERINVYDWDMGMGAYNTTIADRPALKHWLHELLPSGKSRVLLVSQEDRLFRDRWETEHNAFIRQVAVHGGWVICGPRVYNFRREMDCEHFRLACKHGKQYIEFHIKGRLQPARHRAALAGRYAGGPVPWGYVVDYDHNSPTYMHFLPYDPHATIVREHVFKRFAHMLQPSVFGLVHIWEREGLLWPFFGPEVDERRTRYLSQALRRSRGYNGYRFHFTQAQRILTDVTYLGWRVHAGEVAWDATRKAPMICHQPLVDDELFWMCYDRIVPERPPWAPTKPAHAQAMSNYRPHRSRRVSTDDVWFLTPGLLRCGTHGSRYSAGMDAQGKIRLECPSVEKVLSDSQYMCPVVPASTVEPSIIEAFTEQLTLDEEDVRNLAQLAEQRVVADSGGINRLAAQAAEQRALLERAKRRALQIDDDAVAAEFLDEARKAKATIQNLERQIAEARATTSPSRTAWLQAERAAHLAGRIRTTFPMWPRQHQARVLTMALESGVLGPVHRQLLGLYLRWRGGTESRREIVRSLGLHIRWSVEEEELLRRYYDVLTWDALCRMLPTRKPDGIERHALTLGLSRRRRATRLNVVPAVAARPPIPNTMEPYGFPLGEHQAEVVPISSIEWRAPQSRS